MYNNIVYNFEALFPKVYENARRVVDAGYEQLIIEMRDRQIFVYDDFDKRLIRLDRMVGTELSDDDCRKEFGLKLRTMMSRFGTTQSMLSEKTGISQGIISRYINGASSPTYVNARKIANAMSCSVNEFTYDI